jgi:hypothetical protein
MSPALNYFLKLVIVLAAIAALVGVFGYSGWTLWKQKRQHDKDRLLLRREGDPPPPTVFEDMANLLSTTFKAAFWFAVIVAPIALAVGIVIWLHVPWYVWVPVAVLVIGWIAIGFWE